MHVVSTTALRLKLNVSSKHESLGNIQDYIFGM